MLIVFADASSSLRTRFSTIWSRWQSLIEVASHPYRPERHYMRGPGPKWRAKHKGELV